MVSRKYRDSLDYLYGLESHGIVFGLANIRNILKSLGDPHEKLKTIHIGGTNGKGSTAAMIHTILSRCGYRVGLYASPHLISFTERIRINGQEVTEEEVVRLTEQIRGAIRERGIPETFTFFDFTTAMAMLYFVEEGTDLAILEVGLGGEAGFDQRGRSASGHYYQYLPRPSGLFGRYPGKGSPGESGDY